MFTGEYEKKEHYFIHDGSHLIADIGGYMGLLLGFSIYGIFKYFVGSIAWKPVLSLFRFGKTDKVEISQIDKDSKGESLPVIISYHHSRRNRELILIPKKINK